MTPRLGRPPSTPELATAAPHFDERDAAAVADVLQSGWLGAGPVVERFEDAISSRVGGRPVVAVATGTAALHLALLTCGIGPGDEVVVPAMTFVASPQAVVACGATPVFADIDLRTGHLTPETVEAVCTPRTAAVMPVHYGGQVTDMGPLRELARRLGIRVVEDAAHSFGSMEGDGPCGSRGDVACFSFDPIKPLTCGQGGAVVVEDHDHAARVLRTSDLGIVRSVPGGPYRVDGFGLRYRMSDLNAAIGLSQLERFEANVRRRREIWRRYRAAFAGHERLRALDHDPERMVPFLFALMVDGDRDRVRTRLRSQGVHAGSHYQAAHLHEVFAGSGPSLPAAEAFSQRVLTLPLHTRLDDDDVERVVTATLDAVGRG